VACEPPPLVEASPLPYTFIGMIVRDLTYGLRTLLRSPAILVSAVLALALGIGANGTMLGVLDLLLLRPPAHVRDPRAVERVYLVDPSGPAGPQNSVAYPTYTDLVGKVAAFADLAGYTRTNASIGGGAAAREVPAELATANLFHLLGVRPLRGRLFTTAEGDPEHPGLVALVSWELWQRAFGGTPSILGKALVIGKDAYTVVGVLPRGFTGIDLAPVDLWLPIGAAGSLWAGPHWSENPNTYFLSLVARLRPAASAELGSQQASTALRNALAAVGSRSRQMVMLGPVQEGWNPQSPQPVHLAAWLAATSAAVLLIACLNVGSLLIVRALERRRELAVRLALGASRARLIRLLLAESLVVALLGGIAAYAVARAGGLVVAMYLLPTGTPPGSLLDLRLLTIFAALSLGAWLLTGLAPALLTARYDLSATMKAGGHEGAPGRSRLRAALLGSQVALTLVLLVGAGLLVQSLQNVRHLRLGLDLERVLVVTVDLESTGYAPAEVNQFFDRALSRLRHLPGATRVSVATGIPFRNYSGVSLEVPGRGFVNQLAPGGVSVNAVAGDYFATLGTALRLGRALTDEDSRSSERVMVVNQSAAQLLWPGQNPLGRCVQVGSKKNPCATVVGVVEDARRGQLLPEKASIQVFVPLTQAPAFVTSRALFVRAATDPESLGGAVRREVQAVAPNLPFINVELLADLVEPQIRPWKMGAALFSLYGLLALALATIGIFAAVAHAVASRSHELGIRMALGARPRNVTWLVMGYGFGPAALGVAVGLSLAALAGHYLEPLLFRVSAADPAVRTVASGALLISAFLASYLPGLRVRRIDPTAAMRHE
jgi:predicted permease